MDMMKKIYVDVSFLNDLKEALFYLKFLRGLLSRKGKLKEVLIIPIREVYSVVPWSKTPSKL